MSAHPLPLPWRLAQGTAIAVLLALVAALALGQQVVLDAFWKVVIPVLPASFLVAPMLWRNVCPLATLNHWTGDRTRRPSPGPRASEILQWVGVALLFILVPFRHVVLNHMPLGMLALVAVVGLLTLAAGMRWPVRAGFCNGLCPVRPVEALYGQRPLATLNRARCAPCTQCVDRGCIDLWGAKTVPQLLGQPRRTSGWLVQPFGFFSIAFPGLVLAYFLTDDAVPWLTVYGVTAGLVAASALVLGTLILALRIPRRVATTALAALAFGLYYWFAAPAWAETLQVGGPWPARAAAGVLLAAWLVPRRANGS